MNTHNELLAHAPDEWHSTGKHC